MANVKEVEKWELGIYQLETTDPVMGGEDGIDNLQAKQLANRTSYLKKQIENVSKLIPTVPVQSVNGKTGNIQLSAADVGTLTEQQLRERFLPAKLTSGDQPIYEVGERVDFKKRPTFNNSNLISSAEYAAVFTRNGYAKMANGVILQWGEGQYLAEAQTNGYIQSFYTAFPNACLSIVTSDGFAGVNSTAASPVSRTQFRCWCKSPVGAYANTGFFYIAIGF
ncbi:hypothetical protein A9G07_11015 [Gilliamella sp. wkB72]|uniref:gp53-like domain-containing protein n=1 Tax=Gilliamella sp. wkB72 TaxID=3120265 RepID=UPI00081080B0|nr:hypothetical protein [Gilliamella apicola]OCL18927.1 hypothetical protein A9G07_11015 [Gilliamella apicola]